MSVFIHLLENIVNNDFVDCGTLLKEGVAGAWQANLGLGKKEKQQVVL